jgi:integrase
MILTIFRPKRVKNGKPHIARSYRGRYRLDGDDKLTDIPLHTTDKRVARERLEQIVREKQLEAVGILPAHRIRAALQEPLEKHLSDYVADLNAIGRNGKYLHDLKQRVIRLMRECRWAQIKDVTSNSFLSWRTKQNLAPKTSNEYLTSLRSLLNWMETHGRIERNPLRNIQKAQSNGKRVYSRRALTRQEIQRLLAVAGPRKAVYLTAVFTGLRRGELAALEWGDVCLDSSNPFLNVRASTTKNHRQAVIPMHQDVLKELQQLHAQHFSVRDRVFKTIPRMSVFKADLLAAKIDLVDARDQRADFHALRHTLATNLALAGTAREWPWRS